MNIFRLHTKPKDVNPKDAFNYCLQNGVIGMGWQVNSINVSSWDEYYKKATLDYGENGFNNVKYLKNNLKNNDIVWCRIESDYYLALVTSEWKYCNTKEGCAVDIVNIVEADIKKVPSIDLVPGKVIASFRPNRTIQAIADSLIKEYSKYLWNKLSSINFFEISIPKNSQNIFSMLDSEDAEDILAIYLQLNGWIVIPNSRKADTMSYEFYLINKISKEIAFTQVKTGTTPLNPLDNEWKGKTVFLFQSENIYTNLSNSNKIVCLNPKTIEKFIDENNEFFPKNIIHKIDLIRNFSN